MEIDKKKVFSTFFGSSELPEGTIVMTSIGKIYKSIGTKYPPIEKTRGWWERMKVKINSRKTLILKVPLGSHMKDCLEVFNPRRIKKIILLGFCGSLNDNLKIGDIVVPQKEKFKTANVPQMILGKSVLQRLKKRGVDLVDMETGFLNEWGKQNNIPVVSLLIVTDLPNSLPFFSCTKRELQKIDKSIKEVINKLDYYLTKIA